MPDENVRLSWTERLDSFQETRLQSRYDQFFICFLKSISLKDYNKDQDYYKFET